MPKRKKLPKIPDYTGVPTDENKLMVQKSNPLQSLSETGMSLAEFKILDAYLSRINSHDEEKRYVRFEKGELERLLGVSRILKNDLKRRKTMNAIMLVFIILSTMFAGASVNNISAVTGGIDHFFDEAGIPDVVVTSYDDEGKAKKEIEKIDGVSDVWVEHSLQVFSPKNFKYDGKKLDNFIN